MTGKQILNQYKNLVDMFYAQFGESCNVTLYTIQNDKGTVLATKGNMLAEAPGDPMPTYIEQYITKNDGKPDNFYGFINREHIGFLLRTSLHFVYDGKNALLGCLCVSHNMMQIRMIISFLEEFYQPDKYLKEAELTSNGAPFSTVQDFVSMTIDSFMMETTGGREFASLPKKEKLALIEELDSKGIFQVKGSVDIIAQKVKLTKFAIYNYLDEIRRSS